MDEQNKLRNKTILSTILSFSDTLGTQFIQLVIQIVLARLLMPKDFGIIGMVMVLIALSQVFVDSGFTNGLIREKNSTQEDYSTVFFFNLIMAILLYFVMFVSAEAISGFFREPQLVAIVRVLSFVLIINSVGLIQRTILIKNVDFKSQTVIDLVSAVVSGVIAIILALLGFGVWSLVVKTLVLQFLQTLMLSMSNRWVPSWAFSLISFKRLFNFGWKLLIASLITKLYENIYYLIIGRVFSTIELGFYTKAKSLKDVAENSITSSIQKVSYPVLSSIQDDAERLKRGYRKMIRTSVYITFPIMLGLVAIAPQLLVLLLGHKWAPAIPFFQILCLEGILYPLSAMNLNILQVKGRSDLYLLLSILKKFIGISIIAAVLYMHLGIMALMWSNVVNSILAFIINSAYSKRLATYSTFEQIKDVFNYFVMAALMSVSTMAVGSLLSVNILLSVLLQIAFGVSVYIALGIVFKAEAFYDIKDMLRPLLAKIINRFM